VYIFPELKVPTLVNGTETDAPVDALTQNGLPANAVFVVMVFEEDDVPLIIKSSILRFLKLELFDVILILIDELLLNAAPKAISPVLTKLVVNA
jgi:hypothetical protein